MTGNMFSNIRRKDKLEIGSFLELDLKYTGEYFEDDINTARLNSGRSGIYHALRVLNCTTIYLPVYLCPDVKHFLNRKSINIRYYTLSEELEPVLDRNEDYSALLVVNYYGVFSKIKLEKLKDKYNNVIIDNCGAFFMPSLPGCFNVYSCRKFFGVPDGCYVIGPGAGSDSYYYPYDQSSDTSAFLLKRIEKGCSEVYQERMKNEERIDNSDVLKMSHLTRSLMCSLDYDFIMTKRKENYVYIDSLFGTINLIKPNQFADDNSVPLFYPLVVNDKNLVEKLRMHGIYTGRRWDNVLKEVAGDSFEALLSSLMIPLPIDQRYGKEEIDYCYEVFCKVV
jgi:hypothetical protein